MHDLFPKKQYIQSEIGKIFDKLTSADIELKKYFEDYLLEEYEHASEKRLPYIDMAAIARFIVAKKESDETQSFKDLFHTVETILSNCDHFVEELIVLGLFENVQNDIGRNNYRCFDKWLLPLSIKEWNNLIHWWDGKQ